MGATFFYRSASFSRAFVALSAVALLLLVALTQGLFRLALERARSEGVNVARILVIGADPFAVRAARLMMGGLVPCTLAGFVRLPGQESAGEGDPVIDPEEAQNPTVDSEIDDVVLAVPGARSGEIAGRMK